MTPLHILIIDKDTSAAQVTSAGVARVVPHANVVVETNADRALQGVHEHPPDVLIIDPPRHSLTGLHLIRELKAIAPTARIFVLASVPTPALRRELQRLGVDLYLEKPAQLALLLDALRKFLEHHAPQPVVS